MECRFARRDKSVSQNNVDFTDLACGPRGGLRNEKMPSHKSFAMV